jgi:hypothetical protein
MALRIRLMRFAVNAKKYFLSPLKVAKKHHGCLGTELEVVFDP